MRINVAALLAGLAAGATVTFEVPARTGAGPHAYAPVDRGGVVGISFEFFAFPSYFTNVSATSRCLANWRDLNNDTWPPIRIGGTTQDRALFDPASEANVVYSVANAADAPASLTFGPSFMDLAAAYNGSVVLGLNRAKNRLDNTIAAAKVAEAGMDNLQAIELGNEPEYWKRNGQPIASGTWNPAVDAASQNAWDVAVGSALGQNTIIQAGNWNDAPPQWGAANLIATENDTARQYVTSYAHHNYPGGNVRSLMGHAGIVRNLHGFDADIAAARAVGKPYVLGETNSVSGGGAAGVSPTFGAALWTMDYALRAAYSNISRVYFHHGTVGNCQYCFWGRYSMGAPYYGATAAASLLAGAAHLTALDSGSGSYAAYASFDSAGDPLCVLLYNSDYFDGGSRPSTTFVLTGLVGDSVRSKRLTAKGAMARQDQGDAPTFGGQTYEDGTCNPVGEETFETADVVDGKVELALKASEALLVYVGSR